MVNCARCSLRTIVIAAWSPPAPPDSIEVLTLATNAWRGALHVVRGRRSAELARVYRVSGRSASERYRDLVQHASAAPGRSEPSMQSVTYLVKPEWPKIALIYAM